MLTNLEKAVIGYYMYDSDGGKISWPDIFIMLYPDKLQLSPKSITEAASRWKKSPDVIRFTDELKERIRKRKECLTAECAAGSPVASKLAQYGSERATNRTRKEIITELNTMADMSTDVGEKTKIFELINKYQSLTDEEEKETGSDIMRFYTPMLCHECPLYLQKKKELIESGELSELDFNGIHQ